MCQVDIFLYAFMHCISAYKEGCGHLHSSQLFVQQDNSATNLYLAEDAPS